jgi:hypothetical protein
MRVINLWLMLFEPAHNFVVCADGESAARVDTVKEFAVIHDLCSDSGRRKPGGLAEAIFGVENFLFMIHGAHSTGNFPHVSTGNLPPSISVNGGNNPAMEDRDAEIRRIKARMEELGYNQRSLSMKCFGKPDRIRNLFKGKAKNWRADTHKAIMAALWPSGKAEAPVAGPASTQPLIAAIQGVILVLIEKRLAREEDFRAVFNYQMRDYRSRNQPDAAEVMNQLLEFLQTSPSESAAPATRISRPPERARLKKDKS